jgi:Ca2+-transporting ATPase
MLWIALIGVVVLQVLAVEWTPAQGIFKVESLSLQDWIVATLIASSVVVLEESRKLLLRIFRPHVKFLN